MTIMTNFILIYQISSVEDGLLFIIERNRFTETAVSDIDGYDAYNVRGDMEGCGVYKSW